MANSNNQRVPSTSIDPSPPALSTSTTARATRSTRASARQAASSSSSDPPTNTSSTAAAITASTTAPTPTAATSATPRTPSSSRKRKAPAREASSAVDQDTNKPPSTRRSKRQKVSEPEQPPPPPPPATAARRKKGKGVAAMSSTGTPAGPSDEHVDTSVGSSRRKSNNRSKKGGQDTSQLTSSSSRRSKRGVPNKDVDTEMKGTDEKAVSADEDGDPEEDNSDDDDDENPAPDYDGEDDDDDDDPFAGFGRPGGPPHGLSSTLRALSGMMSGVSSRLRNILSNLKNKNDPSVQLIALQDLSEILLVSTEDNLSGHFSPDAFVKELVALMQPSEFGEENPEMMLLACRCIANLMEALPASTANVVYGGAVPVLCQKLLEIHFIDLAEQALSTLEKISVEYPATIVREGGLTACLTYLDFFATSTQRSAVTTAANCCRNIPEDSFDVIRDVMPILLNVLGSSDQKVVEQGSLCVSRVVESFKYHPSKLEELVSTDLLRAILRLLLPGTTNLIGPNIHTQFLRVLAITAKASPRLSAELFKMNIVETLYQILTGVSPPTASSEDVASKLDSVVIMQALIHRPRDQIIETLNVICELLPELPYDSESYMDELMDIAAGGDVGALDGRKKSSNDKRLEFLGDCKAEVKRFAIILFPTLTDAFSSTVNLSVRQKVLTAQLKMLSNLDVEILTEALRSVPYASFLAAILSQQENPSLVNSALQAAELLLHRLGDIYRYQFYREGVIAQITKLAEFQPPAKENKVPSSTNPEAETAINGTSKDTKQSSKQSKTEVVAQRTEDEEHYDSSDGENDDDVHHGDGRDDATASPASSAGSTMSLDGRPGPVPSVLTSMQQLITLRAKKFLDIHEKENESKQMKHKASKILTNLQGLAAEIENFYLHQGPGEGQALFEKLAVNFDGDVLESVTSAELMNSEVVRVLLDVFNNPDEQLANDARSSFLEVFMGRTVSKKSGTISADSPATPFSILIHKLQDLLSRSEHFEVITVHQNTFDGNRSSAASMLAKQIRLKLVADDDSEIPRPYRNIMVSIHAIATFKALDDYLRPRINVHDRPRVPRTREGLSGALAALAAAGLPNPYDSSLQSARQRLLERSMLAAGVSPSDAAPATPPQRASKKSRTPKSETGATPAAAESASATQEKPATRRSSRRQQAQTEPAPSAPVQDPEALQETLECADERTVSDDEDMDDSAALDAIVGELDEDMEEEAPTEDPSAVSVEVATTGKVTAKREDGTRIATPSQVPGTGSRKPSSTKSSASPAVATSTAPTPSVNRPMSYSAAIQATPQDWHIEFSIDGKSIPNETTIYRAVHNSTALAEDSSSRSVWSGIHPIKFRRVAGPPPPEPSSLSQMTDSASETTASGIPASLDKHPATSSILRLLNILHALNANLDDVLAENKDTLKLNAEPLSQFVNTKLTAKLNRQLEEPLIVASNCLPSWSEDLARLYPFLFPFETRHLFLQSTSFGYARSMTRWQNAQSADDSRRDRHRDERPFLGRLQRQKVRISRSKILESSLKVMELYGSSQSILEVEYFEEVGTGLGPTLEFYSTVSKEFSKKKLKMWRESDANDADEYAFGARGLFPAPMSEEQSTNENGKRILHLFKMLGKFVARSMIDSRIIDVSFNPTFFRIGDGSNPVTPSLGAVKTVDSQLASSLKLVRKFALAKKAIDEDGSLTAAQKVEAAEAIEISGARIGDLGLDFTLPGYDMELIPNGSNIPVTIENVSQYVDQVIDMTLGSGVQRQVDAFRAGFTQVFPYSALSAFTPDELVMLFGRIEEDWSLETLMDSIKADHGFNMDSKSVKNLLQTMSELSLAERRDFLQFTTGSPKLPIGGFKSLTPMFTVVCKPSEPPYTSDDYLPSVMTCVNYLKLPDYTDLDVMRRRMGTAIREGQGAFHLS